MIIRKNGKYVVVSESGKSLGEYTNKGDAQKRLRQVEFFKWRNKT